jgi:ubiquinone/menaquinone biosynthesis C-methylase UbiE
MRGQNIVSRAIRYWNRLADIYDENELLSGLVYPEIVAKLDGEFRAGDRVLEIWAGSGLLTVEIAPLVAHVTCTDLAPAMLEKAQERMANLDNVDYHLEDAIVLSFDNDAFDAVVCCNVLHQMKTPGTVVSEFWRVLRSPEPAGAFSGGKLVAVTVCQCDYPLWARLRMNIDYVRHFGLPAAIHPFSLKTSLRLITDSQFEIIDATLLAEEIWPTAYISARKVHP